MTISCFKVFFSKYKECSWLNMMGSKGYYLTKISDSRYYFTVSDEHKYRYSIEFLDCPIQSKEAVEYFQCRENEGAKPIISGKGWIYFCAKDADLHYTYETHKKISSLYLWRMFYMFFFSLIGAVLCGYQLFASEYLIRAGAEGNGRIKLLDINGNTFIDTLKGLWNNVLDFINDTYLALFASVFGESNASIVLAVALPITIILTIFFANYCNEFLSCRSYIKQIKANEKLNAEVEDNAEQGI